MAYLLAFGSAALYGAADFLGGLASRRTNTLAIVVTSQGTGLTLLALMLPLLPEATPSTRDLAWGGVAGLAGGIGVTLLYRALAVGRMAVVAPTTAVCAVMIPVVTSVLRGERLGAADDTRHRAGNRGHRAGQSAGNGCARVGAGRQASARCCSRAPGGRGDRRVPSCAGPKRTPKPACGRSSRLAPSR